LTPKSDAAGKTEKDAEPKVEPESPKEIEDLGNLFEYLEVEDPTEWTSGSLSASSSKTNLTYELEPSDEDLSFAIFCLLKDLTDIRHHVRQTWAEYREKQIAFATAAVTMNTAIALFHRLNDDFVAEFPQFEQHADIIEFLYDGYVDPHHGMGQDFGTYTGTGFRLPSKIFFCDNTLELLSEFLLSGSKVPMYRGDPSVRITNDEEISLNCLSLIGLLLDAVNGEKVFDEDQLIKAISVTRKDKKIYTWVVFAFQLFIDTRRVVGTELDRCIKEFHSIQEWISATTKQSLQFGETNKVNTWYDFNAESLKGWLKELDILCQDDFVQGALNDYYEGYGDRAKTYSWGPFFLYRNHPMLCGLLIQKFLVDFHDWGVGLISDQGSVMTTIHLYNAVQQSGNLPASKG